MKRVILTGATSMIGVATIKQCLKDHNIETITAVVRPGSKRLERLPDDPRVQFVECELDHFSLLPSLFPGVSFDVFYHFAWSLTGQDRNRDSYEQIKNVSYTLDAVHVAHQMGCRSFVGAGSQAEYGPLDVEKISPDTPVHPIQPYGIAKYAAGRFAQEEAKKLGMNCAWVRIFSVYGKFDLPTTMISYTIRELNAGRRPSFTPAEQRWDYLHEDDAGRAFYLVGERSAGIKTYCLGSGRAKPLKYYIETIRDLINPSLQLGIGDLPYTPNAVMNLCADIKSISADTGFVPEIDFKQGIRIIIGL